MLIGVLLLQTFFHLAFNLPSVFGKEAPLQKGEKGDGISRVAFALKSIYVHIFIYI